MDHNDNEKITVLYVEENQDGTTGGSHYCLLDLVKAINKNEFDSHVMFYESNKVVNKLKRESIVYIFNKPLPVNLVRKRKNSRLLFLFRASILLKFIQFPINIFRTNLWPIAFFVYYILKNDIHIIHLNNTVFTYFDWLVAAKLTRRKIVVHQRTHMGKVSKILKYCPNYYDYIIGISEYTKEYLVEKGVDISRYITIYDRIDADALKSKMTKSKQEMKQEFNAYDEQPLIGIIGNIQPWKGQATVIHAVKILRTKYPDLICLLVGDMSDERETFNKEIRKSIKDYGLEKNVIITGFRTDIADIQNALDVFIHASISPEPFGLVVLEAMAMGTAIVASNEGGPLEMITDGESGFLIEPGKPEILANRIDVFLSDKEIRKRMGEAAEERFYKQFSTFDVNMIEAVYHRLLFSRQMKRGKISDIIDKPN